MFADHFVKHFLSLKNYHHPLTHLKRTVLVWFLLSLFRHDLFIAFCFCVWSSEEGQTRIINFFPRHFNVNAIISNCNFVYLLKYSRLSIRSLSFYQYLIVLPIWTDPYVNNKRSRYMKYSFLSFLKQNK